MNTAETSLGVQWLRLHTPNAGSLGLIPGQGTRSHMPQLKIPNALSKIDNSKCQVTKIPRSQINIKNKQQNKQKNYRKLFLMLVIKQQQTYTLAIVCGPGYDGGAPPFFKDPQRIWYLSLSHFSHWMEPGWRQWLWASGFSICCLVYSSQLP